MNHDTQPFSWERYLARWRARPEPERRRFRQWLALGITAVIALFWLMALWALPVQPPAKATPPAAASLPAGLPGEWLRIKAGWQVLWTK